MPTTYFDTFLRAVQNCADKQSILGDELVIFPPSPDYGYDTTPGNALTFGTMGVDGVHYAILTIDGSVCDDSPVVQISPMDFSQPYSVLGDSFLSYLAAAGDVSLAEMEGIFGAEQAGQETLVPFLRDRFDQSRLFDEERRRKLDRFLDLIEPKH
jgi:hypothetical protein